MPFFACQLGFEAGRDTTHFPNFFFFLIVTIWQDYELSLLGLVTNFPIKIFDFNFGIVHHQVYFW